MHRRDAHATLFGSRIILFGMSGAGFFDFQKQMTSRSTKPAVGPTPAGEVEALSVTQLTAKIDRAIKAGFPGSVLVKGEVSNYKAHAASGHHYFTLKDAGAAIQCVMWRSDAARLKFQPSDGMELLATGTVSVYPQQGKYQLYVTMLHPLGQGALELAFQQLKAKLEAEGLFDAASKKMLPRFPRRIVLLTSSATAALQDMLKVLRRYSFLKLSLFHVPVQGDGSAAKIAAAINLLNAQSTTPDGIDVILLARGGGSLEDLWEFNEEIVARAIVASQIPIVTGIGHEVDTSIADLAADYHAHTPTEAAQIIVQHWKTAGEMLDISALRLRRGVRTRVATAQQRLAGVQRHEMFRRPLDRINQLRQLLDDRHRALALAVGQQLRIDQRRTTELGERLDQQRPELLVGRFRQKLNELEKRLAERARRGVRTLHDRLQRAIIRLGERHPKHQIRLVSQRLTASEKELNRAVISDLQKRQMRLSGFESQLRALGPENVLSRGYSITTMKKTGAVVRSHQQVKEGDRLVTQFAEGSAESVVADSRQLPLFE